ncbi:hypothetical protein BDL97_03G016900 [Sphagnum fallax]|uniref:Uncharacterized protein n=1 Tax=Sphagnum jensenii TaxID=128206 RepID=A0ABP0WSM7_9BRYO|nr:hypothetical protein BDL97_03G016900 [Sphagnum fallax]
MHILFKRMHLLVLCQEVSQHTSIHLPSPSCILGENNFWWRFLMCLIPPNLHQYTHHDTGNEYHFTSDPCNTEDMELRDVRNLETILNCQDCLLVIHECKTGMQC